VTKTLSAVKVERKEKKGLSVKYRVYSLIQNYFDEEIKHLWPEFNSHQESEGAKNLQVYNFHVLGEVIRLYLNFQKFCEWNKGQFP